MLKIRNEPLKSCKTPETVEHKECLHPSLQRGVEAHFASYHMYTDEYNRPFHTYPFIRQ